MEWTALVYRILVENFRGRDHMEDPPLIGMTVLKLILTKCGLRIQTGFISFRIRFFEYYHES
jgi:hypothetical protein